MEKLEKIIEKKEFEIIREQLDYILDRSYDNIDDKDLEKILANYQKGDVYKWDKEKVYEVFRLVNKVLVEKSDDSRENANWEIWYIRWYIDAIKELMPLK